MSAAWARRINSASLSLCGASCKSFMADIHRNRHAGQDFGWLIETDGQHFGLHQALSKRGQTPIRWRSVRTTKQFRQLVSLAAVILLLCGGCCRPPPGNKQKTRELSQGNGAPTPTRPGGLTN